MTGSTPPGPPPLPPQRPGPGAVPPRDTLTPGMLEALRKTKPWVRFLAILGFIVSVFLILAGIGVAAFALLTGGEGNPLAGAVGIGLGALYAATAILYIIPSRYLMRCAGAIQRALQSPAKSVPVEEALRYQKSFWKFAGILMLIMIFIYVPGVLAAIAIPNFLAAKERSKQKRTMGDLRRLGNAIEEYATYTGGYPNSQSLDQLSSEMTSVLKATSVASLPHFDGWGNPFRYSGDSCQGNQCQVYIVASAGKDGRFEHEDLKMYLSEPAGAQRFESDIVYSLGNFIRAPGLGE